MNSVVLANFSGASVTTSYGGENIVEFRVRVKSVHVRKPVRSLAEANKWLVKNAAKVDAHAKASTKRLIGASLSD